VSSSISPCSLRPDDISDHSPVQQLVPRQETVLLPVATVRRVDGADDAFVRLAALDDVEAIGRLLHDFNREFDETTPSPSALARRLRQLLQSGDTIVILAGDGPDGLAVLRFRAAIWSTGLECYLAELYVVPSRRRQGLGRALMVSALREARQRGADTMDIGVDEPDISARRLYESLGFSNRSGGPAGSVMFVYEREL
jgi:ribosomal protein S18 acetylase RimI-like enzyme